ncbi:hypothetical protein SLE2022_037270 [Rubroshorea leprosula]
MKFYNHRSQEPITAFEKSPHLGVDSHSAFQQTPKPEKKQGAFLSRSQSMLQRLKSINFHGYLSQPQKPTTITGRSKPASKNNPNLKKKKRKNRKKRKRGSKSKNRASTRCIVS